MFPAASLRVAVAFPGAFPEASAAVPAAFPEAVGARVVAFPGAQSGADFEFQEELSSGSRNLVDASRRSGSVMAFAQKRFRPCIKRRKAAASVATLTAEE